MNLFEFRSPNNFPALTNTVVGYYILDFTIQYIDPVLCSSFPMNLCIDTKKIILELTDGSGLTLSGNAPIPTSRFAG